MKQLVGLACALCGQRIGSIVEGKFCEICEAPVHDKCIGVAAGIAKAGTCPSCGAMESRRETELPRFIAWVDRSEISTIFFRWSVPVVLIIGLIIGVLTFIEMSREGIPIQHTILLIAGVIILLAAALFIANRIQTGWYVSVSPDGGVEIYWAARTFQHRLPSGDRLTATLSSDGEWWHLVGELSRVNIGRVPSRQFPELDVRLLKWYQTKERENQS